MSAAWSAVALVVGAAGGWIAGDAIGLRRATRAAGALGEATRRLLARARELGLPPTAVPTPGPTDAPALADEVERFRFWLDDQWRRSEEERRRLAAVLSGLTEGIVLLDRYGRVLLVNDVARALWPRMVPRLRGRHQIELFQDAACDEAVTRALQTGSPQQAEIERPGPTRRFWRLRVLPIAADQAPTVQAVLPPGDEATPAGALVVVQDITEHRATEQMRRDFVANVSHELQTPLTSVRGYAETLRDETLDADDRRRFLNHILREAERMTALVRDLLALAQVEAPRWAPAEPVELGDVGRDVVAAQGAFARERGVALELVASPATVSGRPEELRRAIDNLVRNALAYTPKGGRVQVRIGRRDGEAVVEVEDTGIGIPEAARARIFERFYRVDRGRSRETGGTGLGLAIVKHTAEGHGGRVTLRSEVGKGSTFTLSLPTAAVSGGRLTPAGDAVR